MKTRLVSVIIPTYNREKLLPETINSVINQTYKNWELIIVDDRSVDNTKELVQKYMQKNRKIKYVLNTNKQGPGGARNQGMEVAKGDFIAFLDSDDIWMKNHLKDHVWFFNNSSVDFIFTSYIEKDIIQKRIVSKNKWLEKRLEIPYKELKPNFIVYKKNIMKNILLCNFIPTQTVAIRKDNLNIRFDEDIFNSEDSLFWLRFTKDNPNVGYINKVNCIVRVHDQNISARSKNDNTLKVSTDCIKVWKKKIPKYLVITPELKKIINKELSNIYFNLGYYHRRINKIKALCYYLISMHHDYDKIQLKAIKKLFIPEYYKK